MNLYTGLTLQHVMLSLTCVLKAILRIFFDMVMPFLKKSLQILFGSVLREFLLLYVGSKKG